MESCSVLGGFIIIVMNVWAEKEFHFSLMGGCIDIGC
jgi:hypothetical protein